MFYRINKGLCLVIGFFLLLLIPGGAALAAPFYAGKIITVTVGHAPGGGYDVMARLFARHLPKYIPGKPTIIINNMPGASSVIAANTLYNLAKPDGLSIGVVGQGIPFAQLLKAEGVRFDLTKFAWIGSTAIEATILAIRNDLPYKTYEELRASKKLLYLTSSGPGALSTQFPMLLKEFTGLNIKIANYPSTGEQMLAIDRKEADGIASTVNSLRPYIEKGIVRPVIRGRVSVPEIENLPVDENFTTDKKGKIIMAVRAATDLVGRPFIAPPATPAPLMNILRKAFAQAAQDPELQEQAKRIKIAVKYVPHDECLKVYRYIFSQPPDIVEEFSKFIKFG